MHLVHTSTIFSHTIMCPDFLQHNQSIKMHIPQRLSSEISRDLTGYHFQQRTCPCKNPIHPSSCSIQVRHAVAICCKFILLAYSSWMVVSERPDEQALSSIAPPQYSCSLGLLKCHGPVLFFIFPGGKPACFAQACSWRHAL